MRPTHPSILNGEQFIYPSNDFGNILTTFDHIEKSALRFPNKVAIQYHSESLNYETLMRLVYGMAEHLKTNGVMKGHHVAVYSHRNINYWISVLAIFKLGAIYTPLDPYSLENTISDVLAILPNATVIVSDFLTKTEQHKIRRVTDEYPSIKSVYFVRVEAENVSNLAEFSLDDIRYAIPTSGSTGKPKCVLVHERSMLLQEFAKTHDLHITENDVIAQSTTQTFDVHIWQGIAPLMFGATVVVLDRCVADSTMDLLREIAEKKITVFELVPSMMGILLDELEKHPNIQEVLHQIASLKYLAVTGEALPSKHCRRWIQFFSQGGKTAPAIVNMYGPSECGDDVGHYLVTNEAQCQLETVPVATRPIFNTRFYLLDEQGNLANPTEAGILHVSGDSVGPGYLGLPSKTAEVFQEHDILGEKVRLYNTGDRVCLIKGAVVYLSRVENSYVKLAGKRVELENFSSLIARHPGVAQTITVKIPDVDRVVTSVTLTPDYLAQKTAEVQQQRSEGVAAVFDAAVETGSYDDTFNHGGWNNYIPGVSFSERAVQENLADAWFHIDQHVTADSRVLEVGCGSGMLSRKTALKAQHYFGTDISEKSVSIAKRSCADLSNVSFDVCDADQLATVLSGQQFDVIFFNAVVNYFGAPEKLEEILKQAAALLTGRGKILVLDVYHLDCKPLLHSQFEYLKLTRSRSPQSEKTFGLLRQKIENADMKDPDLFFHPAFFNKMTKVLPGIVSAQCHLKMGEASDAGLPNPMVRYRYGVVLEKQPSLETQEGIELLAFGKEINSLDSLFSYLELNGNQVLRVTGMPNSRTFDSSAMVNVINNARSDQSIEAISAFIGAGIDPVKLKNEAAARGYRVDNMLFSPNRMSHFDAILVKSDHRKYYKLDLVNGDHKLSNSPVMDQIFRIAASELKAHLAPLSEHATYCVVVPIKEMPLTANGKVDRLLLETQYKPTIVSSINYFPDVTTDCERELTSMIIPFLQTMGIPSAGDISKITSFKDIGFSSIETAVLTGKIRIKYGVNIPLLELLSENLQTLANRINRATTELVSAPSP